MSHDSDDMVNGDSVWMSGCMEGLQLSSSFHDVKVFVTRIEQLQEMSGTSKQQHSSSHVINIHNTDDIWTSAARIHQTFHSGSFVQIIQSLIYTFDS